MAVIKFGGPVADARGSVAGNTYSRNKAGAYIRNRTKPVNPDTTLQQNVRNMFSSISSGWRSLTDEQRASWNLAGSGFEQLNKLGDTYVPSGFQLYMLLNQTLNLVGVAPLTDAPVPEELPFVDGAGIELAAAAASLDTSGTLNDTANTSVILQATPPMSLGVKNAKNKFRTISYIAGTAFATYDALADYNAVFGAVLTNPGVQNVQFRISLVNTNTGQRTTFFYIPYTLGT